MPRLKHWIFDWLETIVVALLLALVIRAFFLQIFFVPSGSMEPTLVGSLDPFIADRVAVNKVIYHFRQPQRFDVVVFRAVPAVSVDKKDLIKRLIGLPGDKIELKKGVLYVNDKRVLETHPVNNEYRDLTSLPATFGPVYVPKDEFFVMGDNRPDSYDSRYWGFVPKNDLIGQAFMRIWPLSKISLIP